MPSEASLANLKPAWPKGQSANQGQVARGLRNVLAMARRASPQAMQTLIDCMHDETAPWPARTNCAIAIIERAWGKSKDHTIDADGITTSITIHIERQARDIVEAMTIDAEAEPRQLPSITINTVTSGSGND